MAQHDYVIANGSGSAVRSDLNNALAAIVSQNSGATEPTDKFAYMWWADTSAGVLKLRNAANNAWISLRELDGTLTIEAGSASTPGLYFAGDPNTGIYSPGADEFAISTGGTRRVYVDGTGTTFETSNTDLYLRFINSVDNNGYIGYESNALTLWTVNAERARIDSSGRLLVGTSSARSNVDYQFGSDTPKQQLEVANAGLGALIVQNYDSATGAAPAYLTLARAGSTAIGSATIVADGNYLGEIDFSGSDGTDFTVAAFIRGEVDGTPGANDMPGRLVFSTTADGASTPTERMRIKANGVINFASCPTYADDAAAGTGGLVAGDIYKTSTGELRIKL